MAYGKKTVLDIVKAVDEKEIFKKERQFYDKYEDLNQPYDTIAEEGKDIKRPIRGVPKPRIPNKYKRNIAQKELKEQFIEIPKLTRQALSEENPLAGGTIKGSQYFSHLRPQGKGIEEYKDFPAVKFNKDEYQTILNVFQPNRTKQDIKDIQSTLVKYGYLHPSEADGYYGRQTDYAARRLYSNMAEDPKMIFNFIKKAK